MADLQRSNAKRIAIVVQRYGAEITGGAEAHARAIAQQLARKHAIDVLTTCAKDNRHWDMAFEPGESFDGPVRVFRFPQSPRANVWRRRTPWRISRLAKRAQRGELTAPYVSTGSARRAEELDWLAAQGPESNALIEHLTSHLDVYDAVMVYSLRYWTAVCATAAAQSKAILVPTLHDEKAMYRGIFGDTLAQASMVFFNAPAEQALADRLYGPRYRRSELLGIGIDEKNLDEDACRAARAKYAIDSRYAIYTGRVNEAKGCDVLLSSFERFRTSESEEVKLVLVGRIEMTLPKHKWLIATGFVDDETRDGLLADAFALVLPSKYESLSLSTLEAMALGVPVIVNGECAVLEDHVMKSKTGYAFRGRDDLSHALAHVCAMDSNAREEASMKSKTYIRENYSWPVVLERVERAIATIGAELRS